MELPSFFRSAFVRYALAVATALAALLLRWALVPVVGSGTLYLTLFPAMMVVTVALGLGPGLLGNVLGIVLIECFIAEPAGRVAPTLSLAVRLAIMLSATFYVGWVGDRLRAVRRRAEEEAAAARASEGALREQVELVDAAQAARRETEARLQNQGDLMNHAREALVVRESDGTILFWNRGAEELYGWPAAEAIGRRAHDLLSTDPDAARQLDAALDRDGHFAGELTQTTRDGRRVVVESRQTASPAGDGRLLVLQSSRDITDRERAERERELTVEFLRLVNQTTGTAELVKAAATFFQQRSGCEALGIRLKDGDDYPYHEARGFSEEFVQLESRLCLRDAAGEAVCDSAGDPVLECMCGNVICGRVNPEKPFFTAGGSFWANDTTRPLASTDDADRQARARNRCNGEGYESVALVPLLVGKERVGLLQLCDRRKGMFSAESIALWERLASYLAVALARSRSQEQLAAEQERLAVTLRDLRDSDRRKGEFIAVLSHELRNPLAPIKNSLHILDRAPPGSESAARAREVIRRQTEHLAHLVDDLLDLTRISRGKIHLQRARVDASEIVRRACDDHRASFQGWLLGVEASGPAWIDADETRVAQIVGNLLQNAARFGREGGAVTVSVDTAGEWARIRVRDDGVGIPPDLLPRLFEPFVQADGGLARTKGGLGLGLALVKGLVELHGGAVRAHSDGHGRGAEFVVELPLAEAPEPSAATPASTAPGTSLEILVIEDNADAARSLADVLELEGHRVHLAADGLSGIAKARELEPQVIICDIGLPDADGYGVARALRAGGIRCKRLIALSGYAQPEDRERAADAGFDAHLAKPPPLAELLALVASAGRG